MQITAGHGLSLPRRHGRFSFRSLIAFVAVMIAILLAVTLAQWVTPTATNSNDRVLQIQQGEKLVSLLYTQARTVGSHCDFDVWAKVVPRRNPGLQLDPQGVAISTQSVRLGSCPPVAP